MHRPRSSRIVLSGANVLALTFVAMLSAIVASAAPAEAALTFTPTSADFGSIIVSQTTASQSITISNPTIGGVPVVGLVVQISGTNAGDFAITNNTCAPFNANTDPFVPGDSCSVTMTFTPSAVGAR